MITRSIYFLTVPDDHTVVMMTMMAMTVKVMMMWSSLTAGLMAERVRDQLHQEEEEEDLATPWLGKNIHQIREAIPHQLCSFFKHCLNGL